jgi:hypothetical protein
MKSGVHFWTLKPKSIENNWWTHIYETCRKNLNERLSAKKLEATRSCHRKGVVMVKSMHQETTISSQVYCETLKHLRLAGHSGRKRGMLTSSVVLLHGSKLLHNRCSHSITGSSLSTLFKATILLRTTTTYFPTWRTGLDHSTSTIMRNSWKNSSPRQVPQFLIVQS